MSIQFANEVLRLTNQHRANAGLAPLTLNAQLNEAAQDHSEDMANLDFFSHTGRDGSSFGDRIEDTGYDRVRGAENIAVGHKTPASVVNGWMNSAGHRANILNGNYKEMGLGYEYLANDTGNVNYKHYWTQVFATQPGGKVTPINNSQPTTPVETDNDPTPIGNNGNGGFGSNNDDLTPKEPTQSENPTPVDNGSSNNGFVNQVLNLTNQYRSQAGLNPLTLNNQLNEAAQGHSEDMAKLDFFDHTGRDGSSVGDRVDDTGYDYSRTGENIAAGQRTAEEVVTGWMNSPGHRANILNGSYKEIGIGYEYLANDTGRVNYNTYWTQVFGTQQGGKVTPATSEPTTPVDTDDDLAPEPIGKKDNKGKKGKGGLGSGNKNNDSSDKEFDFTSFGEKMSKMFGKGDDLTGGNGDSPIAGNDGMISFGKGKNSFNYQLQSGKFNSEQVLDLFNNASFGSSTSFSDFESDLSDSLATSDLSAGQQQKILNMLDSFESLF